MSESFRKVFVLATLVLLAPTARTAPLFDRSELRGLDAFVRLVEDHRDVSSSSRESHGTLSIRDFLDDLKDSSWDQDSDIRAALRRLSFTIGLNLPKLAQLMLRFVDDLSRGGPGLNRMLIDHPDLELEITKIAEILLHREDYLSLRPMNRSSNLYAVDYVEPLRTTLRPILQASANQIMVDQRELRHLHSILGGFGLMATVEISALVLQLAHAVRVPIEYSLGGIPVLMGVGALACELWLGSRPVRDPMDRPPN